MNEGIKQYTIEDAYTDNTEIKMYEKASWLVKRLFQIGSCTLILKD